MKMKLYVHARWDTYAKAFNYRATPWEQMDGEVLVTPLEVEFESISDAELRLRMVQVLRTKKQKTMADAVVECNEIETVIQEMLCLEDLSAREIF